MTEGAAVWAPTVSVPITPASLREGPSDAKVFGAPSLPLALWSRLRIREPPRCPLLYLAGMGVAPEWQGNGLGTALMWPGLDEIDAASRPAYLEFGTSQPRAVRAQRLRDRRAEPGGGGPPVLADAA